MKRHLSLMLVVLLLLGMTAHTMVSAAPTPAAATKVYLSYDFDNSLGFKAWREANSGGAALKDAEQNDILTASSSRFGTFKADKIRQTTTKRIFLGGTYWCYGTDENNSNTFFVQNPNGNWVVDAGSTSTQHDLAFLADETWDGSVNTNETYVISYDMAYESATQGSKILNASGVEINNTSDKTFPKPSNEYEIFKVAGLATDGTSYKFVPIMANKGGYGATMYGTGGTGGVTFASVFGAFEYGHAYRIATGFKYDASKSKLLRTTAADGKVWETNWDDSNALKNIDAVIFRVGANSPMFGKIRVYTINASVPFAVSESNIGLVSPVTNKVTVKLNRPVAVVNANQISVKLGDAPFTGWTLGEVKTVEEGTEIYSTVDIHFTTTLAATSTYTISFADTLADELGNVISLADNNNKATFTTGDYPDFETELSAVGFESGDSINVLVNKNATFNSSFTNTSAETFNAIIFVGIYSVGPDTVKDTADDELIGYSFAKTNMAAGATQNLGFGTKVESGTYVKALSFGCLEDLAADISFNTTNVEID